MIRPQLTSFAAPEGLSPGMDGPVDRTCLAHGRSARAGAASEASEASEACEAPASFGRPGGH
jgi:hypothetical protein